MRKERTILDRLVIKKDLEVTIAELEALRRSVDWPIRGDYGQVLREDLFCIGARLDGRLIGFVHIAGSPNSELLIHSLCVHPDYQHQGVGSRLIETALTACRNIDPQGVNVLFEEKNRPFFERFGFRIMLGGYMDRPTLYRNVPGRSQTGKPSP
jgi:ribosomal protein S18 acetylase RimI-like enzyme